MPNYRRNHREWGCYFLTLVTHQRHPLFADSRARELLHEAIEKTLINWPMTIDEMVLLPNHIHMLCSIPDESQDYSMRIRLIKKRFTHAWISCGGRERPQEMSRIKRGFRGIWQKRFYEHTIRNQREYRAHVTYIHMNPVKHGLAARPVDWPWSTFHRHVKEGKLDSDWMGPTDLPGVGECDNEIY